MKRFVTVSLAGLFIVLALASPVSAANEPGGETLSRALSCPPGKQGKIISYANGVRIEHKWSRLGGGPVYSQRFVGGWAMSYVRRIPGRGLCSIQYTRTIGPSLRLH